MRHVSFFFTPANAAGRLSRLPWAVLKSLMLRPKETAIHVVFHGESCRVVVGRYADLQHISLRLLDGEGLPMATASVNPSFLLEAGLVLIKNYSENAGILAALEAAGVVERSGETVPLGFAEGHVCRLLVT